MRIAVTGATGFIGRAVMRKLAERGHEVRALARKAARFEDMAVARAVRGDLFSKMALAELVSDCDAVLHLAGAIRARGREGFFAVNRDGTANLAGVAATAGVKRFVHVSSLAAREPRLSAYGASKRAAEDIIAARAPDMQTLIVRPSAVYGPGDEATLPLLKALMSSLAILPGSPRQRFSLIHVDDLASVLCDAVASDRTGLVEVDDLEGGHGWEDLLATTRKAFGLPRNRLFLPFAAAGAAGLAMDAWGGLSGRAQMIGLGKIRELYHPDWVARGANWPRLNAISLAEGLPQTVRWHQAEGLLSRPPATDRSDDDPLHV